jgi:hypothetical protein
MGSKASNNYQSNRPESGGADKDMMQEKSGLLEREKDAFAASQKAKQEAKPQANPENPRPAAKGKTVGQRTGTGGREPQE